MGCGLRSRRVRRGHSTNLVARVPAVTHPDVGARSAPPPAPRPGSAERPCAPSWGGSACSEHAEPPHEQSSA
ncbi:hypothetical protein SERN_2585 [Serinibacter arcticus]|uniref:Uncharacterized protein n=1 Tax=Serinibacter arcticus TaxID=1655435 RepID=A0A4Z1DWU2_9MICO|nr:hypothetical protein SERN_2585 [Serinibacter arcticus]